MDPIRRKEVAEMKRSERIREADGGDDSWEDLEGEEDLEEEDV
jgi:hypothetical protein